MESEWLHSKERLAVERRAQQHQKPALEGSAGAAWTRMRQRLSRAEREVRAARRVAIALSGVSVVAVAGALAVAAPWSVTMGSKGSFAEAAVRAGSAPDPLLAGVGQGEGMRSHGIGLTDIPVLPPERPTGSLTSDVEIFRASGAQEGQTEPPDPQGQRPPGAAPLLSPAAETGP